MKIAIISDIHSNFEALSTVFDSLQGECDSIVCLGDIIGYGADPDKCIDLLIDHKVISIMGNHDYAIISDDYLNSFNQFAKDAIIYAKKRLQDRHINYIKSLPLRFSDSYYEFVHAGFYFPDSWPYINLTNIETHFRYLNDKIGFFGHTHIPKIYSKKINNSIEMLHLNSKEISLKDNNSYIINPGSVGQPRDNNSKASYLIFDTDLKKCYFKRVKYDIDSASKKIIDAGLNSFLANRLFVGE